MSPLKLFGVSPYDAHDGRAPGPGASLVHFRDLAAVVGETPVARPTVGAPNVEEHVRVVEAVFAQQSILPAPPGVVFRTTDALTRWLEIHYVTLSDALGFVEGRAGARVYVRERVDDGGGRPATHTVEMATDLETIAAGSFRVLRRHAAASVSSRQAGEDGGAPMTVAASFLVDRERWQVFADVVAEEGRRTPDLQYDLTGPWPPYDFVRMQFGS
ncbi:MAG: GvpL/GvpF family gas vesicle protein [Gemmatimonadaceae bacterium]